MGGCFYTIKQDKYNLGLLKAKLRNTEYIFWDSGFFINLLYNSSNTPWQVERCKELYDILLGMGNKILNVTSDFVVEETANHFISRFYEGEIVDRKLNREKYKSWSALYKEEPALIQKAVPFIEALFQIIDHTPVMIYKPENGIEYNALHLIKTYNLCAMDAYILATMQDAGIEDIITTDVRDLKRIKDSNLINIYSCYDEPRVAV